MKRTLFLLLLLLFLPTTLVQAQTAVTLESLEVELWPDYDQQAVLVLLTGTLPANTPVPVTLTVPLPAGADFNVVARITPDDVMTDQGMTPTVESNQVTFTLTESRFRVEYYQPYTASDTQRNFAFNWQSDSITVNRLSITLQQPLAATDVTVIPAPVNVSEGQDGLTYHVLPDQTVAAGESYNAEINYTMSAPMLTVNFLEEDTAPNADLPILDAVPVESSGFDWQLLLIGLGVIILVGVGLWYFLGSRAATSKRPAKPKPQRVAQKAAPKTAVSSPSPAQSNVNFCHQCGESLTPGDKFCRNCGTAVKNK